MITCKEDLINTYVKNTPELRREFLSTAVKFGLVGREQEVSESSDDDAVVAYWHDVDRKNLRLGCWSIYSNRIKEECRELTLSDLKPRTKTSYEKVTLAILIMNPEFILSGVYQKLSDGSYSELTLFADVITYKDELYRKVEKPIEWWEDAADYVNKEYSFGGARFEDGYLIVDGKMTRDQWCDFARILLEQGE